MTAPTGLADTFAQAMDRLGPFESRPALAVAVSGGADSVALALLARDWAAQRGGSLLALVVDHGLRVESAQEAALTIDRLSAFGIPARLLRLTDLARGPALAERARIARYDVLTQACREAGRLHLLLGHHAADQAETLAMRVLRDSFSFGLAGMAALRETGSVRLLRPLLTVPPAALRGFLAERGIPWVEDPSNQDQRALRPRLRHRMRSAEPDLTRALALAGQQRALDEEAVAAILARRVILRPEGFALLTSGRIQIEALRALLRTIAGAAYPVAPHQAAELAAAPCQATLAGVRLMQAGRLGPGLLVLREEAAIGAPTPPTGIWDNRFRLVLGGPLPSGTVIDKLGAAAARFRARSALPAAVLRTLPALWCDGDIVAVPHLRHAAADIPAVQAVFAPPWAIAGPGFVPVTL